MEALENIIVTLQPTQNYLQGERRVQVSLASRVNFSQYSLDPRFTYPNDVFGNVEIDKATNTRLILNLRNDIVLNNLTDELAVGYSATAQNGDTVYGKIVFPDIDYEVEALPIEIELDACCSLPDSLDIKIIDYYGGKPVICTSIGSVDSDIATVTLTDGTGSDYNGDYNEDFGTDPRQVIVYTLNKETAFWKKKGASNKFNYTISYLGREATSTITIKLNN